MVDQECEMAINIRNITSLKILQGKSGISMQEFSEERIKALVFLRKKEGKRGCENYRIDRMAENNERIEKMSTDRNVSQIFKTYHESKEEADPENNG
ncbi:hypothetical protein CWI36_0204p0040 [Hamiltosporidium magnivora]|uniref:Uncharacterized protein n=1 Tax=Hamiltosporidium magnivora TaxID=148818 RepID=A0A4Q9LKS0_9MICR|nr:hypothetical protein CWI36_0204p0040 [Hamiltosporidium magnivora]